MFQAVKSIKFFVRRRCSPMCEKWKQKNLKNKTQNTFRSWNARECAIQIQFKCNQSIIKLAFNAYTEFSQKCLKVNYVIFCLSRGRGLNSSRRIVISYTRCGACDKYNTHIPYRLFWMWTTIILNSNKWLMSNIKALKKLLTQIRAS